MWVNLYNPFVSNLGIDQCLNHIDCPSTIQCSVPFFVYRGISSLCTKFSSSSIYRDIVVQHILQIWPRWMHEREVMLMTLSYWPLSLVQHSNTIEYLETTCVLLVDIPHTVIHLSPWSIRNSVWTLATQPSLSRSQIYQVLQILNAAPVLHHGDTSNARTFMRSYYV